MYKNPYLYEELLSRAGEGNEVIVVHERSDEAKHFGHKDVSGGGSIYETSVGGSVLGRRADMIYISRSAFWRMHTPEDGMENKRANEWLRNSLMCRLQPSGRLVIV